MSRFRIAPSVLSADFGRLADEVRDAEAAGADWIHVDVMDGHFVPNLTIGPDVVAAIGKATSLPLDVHLMVEHPERYIERFVQAGAGTVGVHVEACPHLHRSVQQIHAAGARACVVLNPATPANTLDAVLEDVEQVLVMTVNPGFGGQSFIRGTLPKLRDIRRRIERARLDVDLVVDGGVGRDTVLDVALHGANVFVMGSAFFGSPDRAGFVRDLRTLLEPYEHPDPETSAGP
jgi:ribulose-phosphate 3-epimerase